MNFNYSESNKIPSILFDLDGTITNFENTIYVKYDKISDLYIELNELEFIEDMEE